MLRQMLLKTAFVLYVKLIVKVACWVCVMFCSFLVLACIGVFLSVRACVALVSLGYSLDAVFMWCALRYEDYKFATAGVSQKGKHMPCFPQQ